MSFLIPFLTVLFGGGVTSLVQFLITRHDERKRGVINPTIFNCLVKLSVAEAEDRIVFLGQCYLDRGWITVKEWVIFDKMFEPYKMLGGNHYAEEIYYMVKKLPRRLDD